MVSNSSQYPYGNKQDVLNGIAYDTKNKVFLTTGKKWPRYYISLLDRA